MAQIATLKTPIDPLVPSDWIRFTLVCKDADSFKYKWYLGQTLLQKNVVSYDHVGNPLVVECVCPYTTEVAVRTTREPELNSPEKQAIAPVSVELVAKGKKYTTAPWTTQSQDNGQYMTRHKEFSMLHNGNEAVMGVHVYRTTFTGGAEDISVKINNATLTGFTSTGVMFYESLAVSINGVRNIIVSKPLDGSEHCLLPQMCFHKEFKKASRVMIAEGPWSLFECAGFAAEQTRMPKTFWRTEQQAHSDYIFTKGIIDAGLKNDSQDFYSNKMGPLFPYYLGDSGSGAPGGWGIAPVEPINYESDIEKLRLLNQCMQDRMSLRMFDQTGKALTALDWKNHGSGTIPFSIQCVGGWDFNWSTNSYTMIQTNAPHAFVGDAGHPYNHGSCNYLGSKYHGGLLDYEFIDDAHFCRATRLAKTIVMFSNDPVVKDDMIEMANFAELCWSHYPNAFTGIASQSVYSQLQNLATKPPHHEGHLERAFGWAMDSIAQKYVLIKDSTERLRLKEFFDAVIHLANISRMPNGLMQREYPGSHLYDVAVSEGMNASYSVAGAIYAPIVAQGLYAIMRACYGLENTIKRYILGLVRVVMQSPNPNGPLYYMATGPSDQAQAPYPQVHAWAGGLESYNYYWSMLYAALFDVNYFQNFLKYDFTTTTHQQKIHGIIPEKYPNAAYYIAEAQNRNL